MREFIFFKKVSEKKFRWHELAYYDKFKDLIPTEFILPQKFYKCPQKLDPKLTPEIPKCPQN